LTWSMLNLEPVLKNTE